MTRDGTFARENSLLRKEQILSCISTLVSWKNNAKVSQNTGNLQNCVFTTSCETDKSRIMSFIKIFPYAAFWQSSLKTVMFGLPQNRTSKFGRNQFNNKPQFSPQPTIVTQKSTHFDSNVQSLLFAVTEFQRLEDIIYIMFIQFSQV